MKRVRQPGLLGRLEQLDGVTVGVFQLDLLAAGTLLDLVAEAETGLLQGFDARRQVINLEDDPVPPARLLFAAVGQRARPRTPRAAEPEGKAPVRDGGEGRSRGIPRVQFEAQVLRVELHRLVHVLDLIPDRPGPEVRLLVLALVLVVGLSRYGRVFESPAHRQQPDAEECRHKPVRHGYPPEREFDWKLRDDRRPAARHSLIIPPVSRCGGSGTRPTRRGPCRPAPTPGPRCAPLARCRGRYHRRRWPQPARRGPYR